MLANKRTYIEMLKGFFALGCAKNREQCAQAYDALMEALDYAKRYKLLPMEILPEGYISYLLESKEQDDWTNRRLKVAGTMYVYLARVMYTSEVANIFNSEDFHQALEMGRVQNSWQETSGWFKNVGKFNQEVLNDYAYFLLYDQNLQPKSQKEYAEYKASIEDKGFPPFNIKENKISEDIYKQLSLSLEKRLDEYKTYVNQNYPQVAELFPVMQKNIRCYVMSPHAGNGYVLFVNYYKSDKDSKVTLYPNYVDFGVRWHSIEAIGEELENAFVVAYPKNQEAIFMWDVSTIHLHLLNVFLSVATPCQKRDLLAFLFRSRLKTVQEPADEDYLYVDEKEVRVDSYNFRSIGVELINNQCSKLIHYYIKEHLSELDLSNVVHNNYTKGQSLIQRLIECPKGSKGWSRYETIGKEIFDYLFADDFENYEAEVQSTTIDNLLRRDLVVNNTPKELTSIWATVKARHNSVLFVVDYKNYENPLTSSEFYIPTKYLNKTTGTFAIIFTRESLSEHSKAEQVRLIIMEGKIILAFSDVDLQEMIQLRMNGRSATTIVNRKYFELMKSM